MRKNAFLGLLAMVLLGSSGLAAYVVDAASTTVVVNETGDRSDINPGDGQCDSSGTIAGNQCSLRAAIEELNALGPQAIFHRITFNIPGAGPHTIAPAAPLPDIRVPIFVDGASQPGASCATASAPASLQIVLNGGSAGDAAGLALAEEADVSSIRGLAIGNFAREGLVLRSDDSEVACTYIGVAPDGQTAIGNGLAGIRINGSRNLLGGASSSTRRNVISANGAEGVRIEAGASNRVENNFIGTTADGMHALGNGSGLVVLADNTIIGARPARSTSGNLVSGNRGAGIRVEGSDGTLILGNTVGLAGDGAAPLGNWGNGIEVVGEALGAAVGGTGAFDPNYIAHNGGGGVIVSAFGGGTPLRTAIRDNAIFANTALGIDLGSDGVDANDPGDADVGENERQNYPALTTTPGSLTINGVLDSRPNTQYVIDVYRSTTCHQSGHGEGQQDVARLTAVTTDATGRASFTFTLANTTSGDYLTATATDPDGNTSEFSACALLSQLPPDATPIPELTPTPTPPPGSEPAPEFKVMLPVVVK